jgi:hypothetical protein
MIGRTDHKPQREPFFPQEPDLAGFVLAAKGFFVALAGVLIGFVGWGLHWKWSIFVGLLFVVTGGVVGAMGMIKHWAYLLRWLFKK